MALQGDLNSFALPDVLRLLAGTGKSGRLEVAGDSGGGDVYLQGGAILSATVSTAPHASNPSDVLYEMLRFDGGSFVFEEGDQSGTGRHLDVEDVIGSAESLVAEWAEVERVVPSMRAWLSLLPEIEGDVRVTTDQWRALAAIGGGGNVRDLAGALELTDLAACHEVIGLVQAGMVAVRPTHGYTPPQGPVDSFDEFDEDDFEPVPDGQMTDLEDLVVEDRPVVMEDSEDALLPEPLPGEGVAYEGETITGVVDGRTFGTHEPFDPSALHVELEAEAAQGSGDADPFMEAAVDHGSDSETSAEAPRSFEAEIAAELSAMAAEHPVPAFDEPAAVMAEAGPVDDERDSLLKFLSSVKP